MQSISEVFRFIEMHRMIFILATLAYFIFMVGVEWHLISNLNKTLDSVYVPRGKHDISWKTHEKRKLLRHKEIAKSYIFNKGILCPIILMYVSLMLIIGMVIYMLGNICH